MSRLSEKVAIVTGASKGIGAGIATAFGAAGARVAVNYSSDRQGAERVAQVITNNGGKAIAVGPTYPRPQMLRGYSKKCIPRSEDSMFWSTTPGYSASEPSRKSPKKAFTFTTTSTFSGRFSPCRKRSSDSGPKAEHHQPQFYCGLASRGGALLYASTKGATETLTKGLALELAPRKIRVNAIAPGHTETEGNVAAGTFEGGAGAVLAGKTPLGRLGRVTDIAPLAVFLASDESAWITGEVIRAAGGLVVAT